MPAPPSWGWPSHGLLSLLQSTESAAGVRTLPTQPLLSYAPVAGVKQTARCGGLVFDLIGQQAFSDMARTADDPLKVEFVVSISLRPRTEIDALRFDIWRHRESGAAIAVPAGAVLSEGQGRCTVRSADGQFVQMISGSPAPDALALQSVSNQFEVDTAGPFGQFVQWDNALTTPGPQTGNSRTDGLIFVRKGIVVSQNTSFGIRYAHLFETLLSRSGTFVGVLTVNMNYGMFPPICSMQPDDLSCVYLKTWAHYILATQLSSFPVF